MWALAYEAMPRVAMMEDVKCMLIVLLIFRAGRDRETRFLGFYIAK